ncbi:helix-turn-helix transcriptional regulator [Kitasatospora sp. NPDC085895]|uniref:helix-turn-helix domain-containing protein n=1 Tax=Kitasatospora sp. NPDC085895 TaxID=3155057 RepID=UPI003450CCC6
MSMLHTGGGVTAHRLLLGSQLRRLREARGVTREEAGYSIRASESKISRMELGRVGFKERDVADLLTLYGLDRGEERATLLGLVAEANAVSWWHGYEDVVPTWFQTYLGLEEAAASIASYEIQFVPGLLQTEEYARAVVLLGRHHATAQEVDRRVAVRMRRQQLLAGGRTPALHAVIDEAALRRPCGGPEVMRGQLRHLVEAAARPEVTLQVVPLGTDLPGAEAGAFSVLGFTESELPDVVYLEQFTSALYLDRPTEVAEYAAALRRLSEASLSHERSLTLIRSVLQDI